MSYLVLARKWRPQTFEDVVGQEHITQTLSNAINMDRVAHAFVFSGVRGVGKTSLARILAKSLNCKDGPTATPCGVCESCKSIVAGTAVDVIEIDGASNNSVDDIRDLRETVPYRPALGRFKIYVIDEVHMLSVSAFNALLKTLEEPPPHVKFIFATTEPHKIPVTILSRCQRYDFRRIPTTGIIGRIRTILDSEQIKSDDGALALIGREAEGSMRDALSILDQVLAAGSEDITAESVAQLLGVVGRKVLYDLSGAVLDHNPRLCLEIVRQVDHQGYDMTTFARSLLEHLRNLVVAGVCRGSNSVLDLPQEELEELTKQAASTSNDTLHRLFKHFSEAYESISRSSHPRILLETTLARVADLGQLVPAVDLIRRLEAMAAKGPARPGGGGGGGGGQGRPPHAHGSKVQGASAEKKNELTAAPQPQPQPEVKSQPQPEAKPQPKSGAPAVELNMDAQWPKIIADIQRISLPLASFLECGVPAFDKSTSILTIRFAREYEAAATMTKSRANEIVDEIKRSTGLLVQVNAIVDEATSVPVVTQKKFEKEEQARLRDEQARSHPLVRKAIAHLGGTVVGVQIDN